MAFRTLAIGVSVLTGALLCPAAPSAAGAQDGEPGTRPAALEADLDTSLLRTREAARTLLLDLQRGATVSGLGSLSAALERIAAADMLIAGKQ